MTEDAFNGSVKIKKSPVVMVKIFLLLELAGVAFFFISGYYIYYARWYRSLSIGHYISFSVAEAMAVLGFQTLIMLYSFLRWHRGHINIKSQEIVYARGVLVHKRTTVPFSSFTSASWSQGFLGRKWGYGDLILHNGGQIWKFSDVPNPRRQAEIVLKFKRSGAGASLDVNDVLNLPESEKLEFKSTLRWDLKSGKVNKLLERAVMKTIAAFMNSQGGYLVLGIDDRRQAVGLELDFASLGKPGPDGFEVHFSHLFQAMLGSQFRHHVQLAWHNLDAKACCLISVTPSPTPVYLKQDEREEFFIRTGNGTTSLQFSEAASYIDRRFRTVLI